MKEYTILFLILLIKQTCSNHRNYEYQTDDFSEDEDIEGYQINYLTAISIIDLPKNFTW